MALGNNGEVYRTRDQWLAATLWALGWKFSGTQADVENPKMLLFSLTAPEGINVSRMVGNYYRMSMEQPPQPHQIILNYRALKNVVEEWRRGNATHAPTGADNSSRSG